MYYLHYSFQGIARDRKFDDFSEAMTAYYDMVNRNSYGRDYGDAYVDAVPPSYNHKFYIPYDVIE